jgi:hypothetical protein
MAARLAINHVLAFGQLFELTQETTYQKYAYAVRSNHVYLDGSTSIVLGWERGL